MIRAIYEYNNLGCMLYALDYPGAFAKSKSEAIFKLYGDVKKWCA